MNKIFVTKNAEETQQLGFYLAKKLTGGEVIALYGDLGSGKTTFTQGLAKGLGIKSRIISPTFIIMRSYEAGFAIQGSERKNFYHVDLYRVESEKDIEGLGLLELFGRIDSIIVLEWPEKLGGLLPEFSIKIHFSYEDDDRRKIEYE